MRWLAVPDTLLDALDVVLNMAVGHEDVLPSVVIVVEEETREAQCEQAIAAHLGTGRLIHEQALPFIVVEGHHLIGEVANDDARPARAIVIGGINAHAGTRDTILAIGNSRLRSEEHT